MVAEERVVFLSRMLKLAQKGTIDRAHPAAITALLRAGTKPPTEYMESASPAVKARP